MIVCFDTAPLIWGVQGSSRPGQEGMIPRARAFIDQLDADRARLIIPAPVIAEYLVPFSPTDRLEQLRRLQRRFRIIPLDMRAGMIAAEIGWRPDDGAHSPPHCRECLRADALVVACALAGGADLLVTHDAGATRRAAGRIRVQGVPELTGQLDLLAHADPGPN